MSLGKIQDPASLDYSWNHEYINDLTCNTAEITDVTIDTLDVTDLAVSGDLTVSGSVSCGAITSSGNFTNGTHTMSSGAVSCSSLTSTGAISAGTSGLSGGALSCSTITASGALSGLNSRMSAQPGLLFNTTGTIQMVPSGAQTAINAYQNSVYRQTLTHDNVTGGITFNVQGMFLVGFTVQWTGTLTDNKDIVAGFILNGSGNIIIGYSNVNTKIQSSTGGSFTVQGVYNNTIAGNTITPVINQNSGGAMTLVDGIGNQLWAMMLF